MKGEDVIDLKFIKMQNIIHSYKYPNIIDIKLGQRKEKKKTDAKFAETTTNTHQFRLNGLSMQICENGAWNEYFMSKYYGQTIKVQ
jgi:hypothetical protein